MINRLPRLMLAAIATICAACIVIAITGLTGMYLDADARADRALADDPPASTAPATDSDRRELEDLRNLFEFCQANWDAEPCAAALPPIDTEDGTRTVYARVPSPNDDDDDGGDTRVTVQSDAARAPSSTPTTSAPSSSTPSPAGPTDPITETVEDTTETVEEVADRLADIAASAVEDLPTSIE